MSLSVDAVNSVKFNANNNSETKLKQSAPSIQANHNAVSFGDSGKAMRNYTLGGLLLIAVPATVLSGCDAKAEAWAYAQSNDTTINNFIHNCGCCGIHKGKDTVYIHDSIPQIIHTSDTIFIKPDYKSPVIDSINSILDNLDIDHGDKYIPWKISYVDEMDTKYKQHVFDGRYSSEDQVMYRSTVSPWSDDESRFVVGTPLDEKPIYLCSLTDGGKLMALKCVPKLGVTNPRGLNDYMYASEVIIFDNKKAEGKVDRSHEIPSSTDRIFDWSIRKGDVDKTVLLTNPYDATWRNSSIKVISKDGRLDDGE